MDKKWCAVENYLTFVTVTLHVGSAADKKWCTADNVVNIWPSAADKDIALQKILYAF